LLNGKLVVHEVDVEWLCSGIIRQSGFELRWDEREDLLQHLVIECWRLGLAYRPGVIKLGFRKYAAVALRRKAVDWQRKRLGRTRWVFRDRIYERPPTILVSLDAGLGELESQGASDPADGCDLGLSGLDDDGYRQRARDLQTLGIRPPRRAA
jgi:hypothetical protein